MTITITSTTSDQAELDHAVSADWKTPPERPQKEEPPESGPILTNEPASERLHNEEIINRSKKPGGWQKRIDTLTRQKKELAERLSKYESGNGTQANGNSTLDAKVSMRDGEADRFYLAHHC